jgi:hypothetical protein
MAIPNTRQTLKDYCLRKLGAPVLEINVDDDQLEDRIDDALQLFQEYHFDASEKMLLKHRITASTLTFSTAPGAAFKSNEKITGGTSNASAIVVDEPTSTTLRFRRAKDGGGIVNADSAGSFTAGETVTGGSSGSTGIVQTVVFGDVDNHYIPIDDSIIGVERVFPFDHAQSDVNMFDVRYQLHLNDIYSLSTASLINYDFAQRRISQLEDLFNQAPRFAYSRHADRLHLDIDWENQEAKHDNFLLLEVYKVLDPSSFTQIYNDLFLKKYLTSLFKKQWGANLIKFEGLQLPGGVTLNGRQLYDDAQQEIEKIEEDMQLRYSLPDDFFIG